VGRAEIPVDERGLGDRRRLLTGITRQVYVKLDLALFALIQAAVKKAKTPKGKRLSLSHWIERRLLGTLLPSEEAWLERQLEDARLKTSPHLSDDEIRNHLGHGYQCFLVDWRAQRQTATVIGIRETPGETLFHAYVRGRKTPVLLKSEQFVSILYEEA